jgi:hypothetical protein
VQAPPALTEIHHANRELQAAKAAGAHERFPDDYTELEKRYQLARGTFYACQDAQAMALAQTLADAQALTVKRVVVQAPPPANQPPIATLRVPAEGELNRLVTFQAADFIDPDGDRLSYRWDFGDGSSADSTSGVGTHQYTRPGNYTVSLAVEDGSLNSGR